MKKALLTLAALAAVASSAFAADGTISFLYFGSGTGADTPVKKADGTATDSSFTVALFAGNQVGNNSATPLATASIFQNTGLFQSAGGDVAIPGSTPGQSAVVTLKFYDGGSFATAATQRGEVSFTTQALGGPNPTPPPPAFTSPDLGGATAGVGFHGITLVPVPEPTTYALGMLGLGALAMIRRRK